MEIESKKLLTGAKKKYTLTVTTNPASATCTLTYGGNSYTSKSATVEEGTIISYSVYQSTYGTTTGSIAMDSDKTLICEGTYSTSTHDRYKLDSTLTVIGTPTITSDGLMSNITKDDLVRTINKPSNSDSRINRTNCEIQIRFKYSQLASKRQCLTGSRNQGNEGAKGVNIRITKDGYLCITCSASASTAMLNNTTVSSTPYLTNTWYTMNFRYDGSKITVNPGIGSIYTKTTSHKIDWSSNSYIYFGWWSYTQASEPATYCTIDLANSWYKFGGNYFIHNMETVTAYNYYWDKTIE